MRLRSRILLVVLPALLAAGGAIGFAAQRQLASVSEARVQQGLGAVTAQLRSQYHETIRTLRSNVELFSQSDALRRYLATEDEGERFDLLQPELLALFKGYHRAYPTYYEIRVLLNDGYEDTRFIAIDADNVTDEEADSPVFKALARVDEAPHAGIYVNPDIGASALYAGKAIIARGTGRRSGSEGERQGYVVVTSSLDILEELVNQPTFGDNARLLVTDAGGTTVAGSPASPAQLPASLLRGCDNSGTSRGGATTTMASIADRRYLYSCRRLGTMLHAVALLPAGEIAAERRRLALTLGTTVAVVLLIVALAVSTLLRRTVISPVETLAQAVRRVGEGQLEISPRLARNDEIGALAESVAEMTEGLRDQRRAIAEQAGELRELAYYDSLTKLPNRALFREQLAQTLRVARRDDSLVALMFVDLDGFKRVNDTLGHDAGDELLSAIGERLRISVRSSDVVSRDTEAGSPGASTAVVELEDALDPDVDPAGRDEPVARLGGDEFTILLSSVARPSDIMIVAQRVIEHLGEPMVISGVEVVTTPSVGIAMHPQDGDDAETLLRRADTAMYEAKRQGKNRYCFYSSEMESFVAERVQIERRLRYAIDHGGSGLALHYQPIITASTGKANAVEALLRWDDAELGQVAPDVFIPVAEEIGLITQVGQWVLHEASACAARWQDDAAIGPIRMCINVAGTQFLEVGFLDDVAETLERTGLQPHLLELELTERTIMGEGGRTLKQLDGARALGVGLAIDDFGTGYSSLAYLKRFPINLLKVDRSFVTDIDSDPSNQAISDAIIAMATALDMETVAEGVETRAELDTLCKLGINLLQGWYYAKAMPEDECRAWLLSQGDSTEPTQRTANTST